MIKNWVLKILLLALIINSCTNDPEIIEPVVIDPTDFSYLFLSHTRQDDDKPNKLDQRVEKLHFSNYDMLLLGGDLTIETSKDTSTIEYIDQYLSIGNNTTLWALGNHDYDNINLIKHFTQRNNYYSYSKSKITFLVLDTQDSLSNFVGEQMELIKKVTDTLSESTHLILLMHKLVWIYGNPELTDYEKDANAGIGTKFYEINPNNFYENVYPLLLDVLKRDIEVICISGDLGKNTKSLNYVTEQGIEFLACGLYDNDEEDVVLILEHDIEKSQIKWHFQKINTLIY